MDLSWLQQQQDKLLHGMLAQGPLPLSGSPLAAAAHETPRVPAKWSEGMLPWQEDRVTPPKQAPHYKEMPRATIERVWATQPCQGTGVGFSPLLGPHSFEPGIDGSLQGW